MRTIAAVLILLLAGCAPTTQIVEREAPNVEFKARVNEPELGYTVFVLTSEPLTIRSLVLQGDGFVEQGGFCKPWGAVPDGYKCAEGVAVQAVPHGFRLNFTASERPVGNVCLRRLDNEVLFCKNLTFIDPPA